MQLTDLVPAINIETYKYIYVIENVLRELIIQELNSEVNLNNADKDHKKFYGPGWYLAHKNIINNPIKNFETRKKNEIKNNIGFRYLYHPIYYHEINTIIDLIKFNPHKSIFEPIFKNIESFKTDFDKLAVIRNKVAHNKILNDKERDFIKLFYDNLTERIGINKFEELFDRSLHPLNIEDVLREFYDCIIKSKKIIDQLDSKWNLDLVYNKINLIINTNNWFSEDYLGTSICDIQNYLDLLKKYDFHTNFGLHSEIKNWINNNDFDNVYSNTLKNIKKLYLDLSLPFEGPNEIVKRV